MAFALHEVLLDAEGSLRDLIFLEVNRAFEAITGLGASQVVGRRVTETMPGIDLLSSQRGHDLVGDW